MSTKNISITTEAYEQLSRLKKDNESFSQVILRVAKPDVSKYFGMLSEKQVQYAKSKIAQRRNISEKKYDSR